jgi:pimeloyl-ACP methyl ester carboxylesterase
MPQLFALLVGCNEYHKNSGVGNLRGCVSDVNAVKDLLVKTYQTKLENIVVLVNAEATRENVIKQFQQHLAAKAKAGDVALFYYSGHGSTEKSSPEFLRIDSKGTNETLVLHDSRYVGKNDLADKELAVMISQINQQAHTVVMLDSCHSGSATRSADEINGQSRMQASRFGEGATGAGRALTSYMLDSGKFYTSQSKTNITVPDGKHVLLSACDYTQVAMETGDPRRGLFTTTLINVLIEAKGQISYADLRQKVNALIKAGGGAQTPQINAYDGFSASWKFLSEQTLAQNQYAVNFIKATNQWVLDYGAVHGMPINSAKMLQTELKVTLKTSPATSFVAKPISVSMNSSVLQFSGTAKPDATKAYVAEFTKIPVEDALTVWLNAQPAEKTKWEGFLGNNKNASIVWTNDPKKSKYELRLTGKQILVYHLPTQKLITGFDAYTQDAVVYIWKIITQIEKWERTWRLEKAPTQLSIGDFEVRFVTLDEQKNTILDWERTGSFGPMKVNLDLEEENGIWTPIRYKVEVKNNSNTDVHASLLFQSRFYDIKSYYPSTVLQAQGIWTELKVGRLGITDLQINEVANLFKLVISTEKLNDAAFTQPEIELGKMMAPTREAGTSRGDDFDDAPAVIINDWFVQNIKVNISRCLSTIQPNTATTVRGLGLTIQPNPSITGKISVASANNATRSVDSSTDFGALAEVFGCKLLDLKPEGTRDASTTDMSVIEISNIANEKNIKRFPLDLRISQPIAKNEQLIAVARDPQTGLLMALGTGIKMGDNETRIVISKLPPPEEQNTRSLGRAIKFAILKIVLKQEDNLFKLQRAVYAADGTVTQTEDGVAEAVAKAKKVVLVVHGIIGNTSEQVAKVRFATETKGYDLVLSYDYENLNTKIEDIAKKFLERLKAAGFTETDGKSLTIIAHSMGGLVSRYMIENLKGETIVDKLIMCGTPNGGSVFGKLPGALSGLNWLLGLGLNFVPQIVGDIIGKLDGVSKAVFVTLKQMDPKGAFILGLAKNTAPTKTIYYALAGNIEHYRGPDEAFFGKLIEQLEVSVGKLAYKGIANDIAVSSEAAKSVPGIPVLHTHDIICHHLNYFSHPDSLAKLDSLL